MQDFRLVLIVVGAIAIAALLIHGLWSNQKSKPKSIRSKPVRKVEVNETPNRSKGFDADGLGKVRVVSTHPNRADSQDDYLANASKASFDPINNETKVYPSFSAVDKDLAQANLTPLSEQDTAAPVITASVDEPQIGLEPSFTLSAQEPAEEVVEYTTRAPAFKEPFFDEYGQKHFRESKPLQIMVKPVVRPEPVEEVPVPVVEPEIVAEPPEAEPIVAEPIVATEPVPAEPAAPKVGAPQDVFVVNVMSKEGELFAGAELLQVLTSLGAKFGEMDIFHRHSSSTGIGPVVFSIANMVKPGTFDVDHMEQFETHGVSLFMALPCAGNPTDNFKLMLHAAEKLSTELNGLVFDGSRQLLTGQKAYEYMQRIADFERKEARDK